MAKTYDTYKDSGIAWIGEIPGEWEVSKMKYIGTYINGYAFKPTDWQNSGKPIIRIQDLTGSISNSNYYNGDLEEKYLVKKGDILVSWAATLDAFIWEKEEEGWLNQHIFKALPNISVINKHYFFWLVKVAMSEMNNDNKHGIVMQHVTLGVFNLFKIPLPPLSEQEDIATCLDEKCGEIDSLISIQEEMISELLAYKQSVITEAVTKGLDKKAKMKNSGVEWIGDIPEEWEVIKIQYLNQGLTDGTHGTYNRVDKGRLLLSSKNVREKDLLITDSESQISEEDYQSIISNGFPKKGDLLMCCIGASIGRCIIYKYDETYAFQRSVIFIRCNKLIKPELLRYNLLSNNSLLQELFLINQSAQAGLYQGQVKEIKVIVPPISKQKQIIDYLDEKTSQINSLIALKQSKIESLKEYKKSIIYEYVTGKKRV